MTTPPFTESTCPVMNPAAGDAAHGIGHPATAQHVPASSITQTP